MSDGIPKTWETVSLGELGEWRGGGTPSKAVPAYWNGSIPWVSPKDMKTGSIADAEDHITEDAIGRSATSLVPGETVLMVTRSGILAHSFPIAVAKTAVALNQDLKALIPYEGVDAEFLAWALRRYSQDILARCSKHGTTVHSIENPRLQQFKIPLAPTNEQRRIVDKVDELFSQVEAGEEALERAQRLLGRYRQSVLNAAVTGELTRDWRAQHEGELESGDVLLKRILRARREAWEEAELAKMHARGAAPRDDRWKRKYREPEPPRTTDLPDLPEGWVWASLDQLSTLITSGSRNWKQFYGTTGALFIRAQNLKHDRLDLEDVAFVALSAEQEGVRTKLSEGHILITITGANVTKSALVKVDLNEAYVNQHVGLVRPTLPGLGDFLHLVIVCPTQGRLQLEQAAYGAGRPGLNLQNLAELVTPLPPAAEQDAIVQRAQELVSRAEHALYDVAVSEQLVRAIRSSILGKAFSGQLVPQDPADEPASVLLERIREEQAAAVRDAGRNRPGRCRGETQRRKPAMVKARKEIRPTHLRDIIHASNGGMAPDTLWKASELDIDNFYKQLRAEVAAGHLHEERDGHTLRIVCR